jgi:VWFA-related protein
MSVLLACLFFAIAWSPQQSVATVPSAPAEPGDLVISTGVNLVMLDVVVRDPKGGYVSGLKPDNFRVSQDDKPQPIKYFSMDEVPVTMGLVIDNSGSMRAKQTGVAVAAIELVGAGNPQDEIFVVNFNDTVKPGLPSKTPFSDDIPTLRAAIEQSKPEGRTKLYDALGYSLQYLDKGRMDKKTLVVVSDGRDNASTLSRADITQKIEQSRATVYAIDIFDEDDLDAKSDVLKKLAQMSGGEYFLLRDMPQIAAVCAKIAADIRHRYTISYSLSKPGEPGSVHSVKVTASSAAGQKLVVRTRTRYMVPERK